MNKKLLSYLSYLFPITQEITFPNLERYAGEWRYGKRNGQGTHTFAAGDKYVGEWKNDKFHGQGTWTNSGGEEYVGDWRDGLPSQGALTYGSGPNKGDKYVGGFKGNMKCHGQGTYTFASGHKYVGEYKDGKKDGQGTETLLDGTTYVGEWRENERHGQGTITNVDGSSYIGEFKDGEMHGQGTYKDEHYEFVGEWIDGIKNPDGQGTETWVGPEDSKLKSTYVGEFKHDLYHGHGTLTYGDGLVYVGEFRGSDFSHGTMTYADGKVYVGEWKDDKPWNGTDYDKDGNVTATYSEGVKTE